MDEREKTMVDGGLWELARDICGYLVEEVPEGAMEDIAGLIRSRLARTPEASGTEPAMCSACAGEAPDDCICDGVGTEQAEMHGLRTLCFRLENDLARVRGEDLPWPDVFGSSLPDREPEASGGREASFTTEIVERGVRFEVHHGGTVQGFTVLAEETPEWPGKRQEWFQRQLNTALAALASPDAGQAEGDTAAPDWWEVERTNEDGPYWEISPSSRGAAEALAGDTPHRYSDATGRIRPVWLKRVRGTPITVTPNSKEQGDEG